MEEIQKAVPASDCANTKVAERADLRCGSSVARACGVEVLRRRCFLSSSARSRFESPVDFVERAKGGKRDGGDWKNDALDALGEESLWDTCVEAPSCNDLREELRVVRRVAIVLWEVNCRYK